MSTYDPDRMTFEDLDLNVLEMVDAYLNHPNTVALHKGLGRRFRALPAAEQIVKHLVATDHEVFAIESVVSLSWVPSHPDIVRFADR